MSKSNNRNRRLREAGNRVVRTLLGIAVATALSSSNTVHALAADKVLYFTFDDGPSQRYTPKILDVLKEHHVKATFFVLGSRSEQFPGLVHRIVDEGHAIGSHGYYHEFITRKPDEWVRNDVVKADAAIRKASGVKPVFYRPPGGIIDPHELTVLRQIGHPVVLWTLDSQDWKADDPALIVNNVMRRVLPGSIVLFHDGVSNSRHTAEALQTIIEQCRREGYTFKTLTTHDLP